MSDQTIRVAGADLEQMATDMKSANSSIQSRLDDLKSNLEKIFGVTREEFLSGTTSFVDDCHPDDIEKIRKTTEELRRDKQPKTYFYRFLHR